MAMICRLTRAGGPNHPRRGVTQEEGSPKRRDPLATQAMIEFARFALQPEAEAVPCARIGGVDPPAFSSLRKPELLVGVVAAAEGDLARVIVRQHALGHLHREERADRKIVKSFVVRKLVNDGASVPQDPKLRGSRHAVDVVDAEPQRPELGSKAYQCRNELRERL